MDCEQIPTIDDSKVVLFDLKFKHNTRSTDICKGTITEHTRLDIKRKCIAACIRL